MRKKTLITMISALLGFNPKNQAPTGYEIKNEADAEAATMYFYGYIGDQYDGVTAKQVALDLKALNGKAVDVRISSLGGSVFEGANIYNLLDQYKGEVNFYIDSAALSIASVIAMAGKKGKVRMAENAWLMIHRPSAIAFGYSTDLRKQGDLLDALQKHTLLPAYRNKTGKSDEDIEKMIYDETWLNAQQALEQGFVDEIIEPSTATASFDLAVIENYHAPNEFLLQFCGVTRAENKQSRTEQSADDPVLPPADSAQPQVPAPQNASPEAIQEAVDESLENDSDTSNEPAPSPAEAERSRVEAIMDLCTTHHMATATAKKLISNGTTIAQARDFAFELAAIRDEATSISGQQPGNVSTNKNPLLADAERRAQDARNSR